MKTFLVLFLYVFLITTPAISFSSDLPIIIKNGFSKYEKEGPKAAIAEWTKGSAVEGSKEALSHANQFRQIQDFYGNYLGYEVVKVNIITPSTSVVLTNINYEKGNLYSTFFCYQMKNGKIIINSFNFHTTADVIWPKSIIYGAE